MKIRLDFVLKNFSNEAPSDIKKLLDGVTYPWWKMTRISTHQKNVLVGVTQQAIIRDQ